MAHLGALSKEMVAKEHGRQSYQPKTFTHDEVVVLCFELGKRRSSNSGPVAQIEHLQVKSRDLALAWLGRDPIMPWLGDKLDVESKLPGPRGSHRSVMICRRATSHCHDHLVFAQKLDHLEELWTELANERMTHQNGVDELGEFCHVRNPIDAGL